MVALHKLRNTRASDLENLPRLGSLTAGVASAVAAGTDAAVSARCCGAASAGASASRSTCRGRNAEVGPIGRAARGSFANGVAAAAPGSFAPSAYDPVASEVASFAPPSNSSNMTPSTLESLVDQLVLSLLLFPITVTSFTAISSCAEVSASAGLSHASRA